MDKWQAQQAFWSSFGIPAYDEQSIFTKGDQPDRRPEFPHIRYQSFGGNLEQTATLSASLWYRGTEMAQIKRKATEIERFLKENEPYRIKVDGGYLWIRVPTSIPFAQPMGTDEDNLLRIVLTVEAESLTAF